MMNRGNWFQHTLQRSGWRPQNQAIALATVGLFIALIIGALYLSQVASNATTGRVLEELLNQRNELQSTNEQLRAEVGGLKSVPNLLARAQALGFVPADDNSIEYLVIDGYNPNRVQTVAPVEQQSSTLPTYDESFGGWLQQQWDALRSQFQNFGSNSGG